jgi:predicted kinase
MNRSSVGSIGLCGAKDDHRMFTAIIVCGSPGAGKTTYGKALAAGLGAVFLDIDTATERLVRLALRQSGGDPDDRDSADFKRVYREPIYEQLFDIARDNLPFNPVVIAGPFTREIQDARWPQLLSRHLGAPVELHFVRCRPAVRRDRLLARGDARDRAKLEDWDTYLAYYAEEAPPKADHVLIDTSEHGTDEHKPA